MTCTPTTQTPTTNFATTQTSTTNIPTTQFPSTNEATTNNPTTNFPTTQTSTTNILTTHFASSFLATTDSQTTKSATTNFPSTMYGTTQFPITNQASTIHPPTQFPTTNTPSTNAPSTFVPSSENPTTQIGSTFMQTTPSPSQLPSTVFETSPSTLSPFTCFYLVPNCQLCDPNPTIVDTSLFNISCSLVGNSYEWIFKNKTGGAIINDAVFSVNGTTTVIAGNFSQTSNGTIVFVISANSNNNKSSSLNVEGCVSINGNISLNLQTQPQQGTTNLQVISYNCSQQVNVSSSQIGIIPKYNGSECDTINSHVINQPNSLGVSLTSALGNKCGGKVDLGLIIGISVGFPLASAVVGLVIFIMKKKQQKDLDDQLNRIADHFSGPSKPKVVQGDTI